MPQQMPKRFAPMEKMGKGQFGLRRHRSVLRFELRVLLVLGARQSTID